MDPCRCLTSSICAVLTGCLLFMVYVGPYRSYREGKIQVVESRDEDYGPEFPALAFWQGRFNRGNDT